MATRTQYDHGTFSWVELATTDIDAAKRFYSSLFGWTFADMPAGPGMTYSMIKLGDQDVGGAFGMGKDMQAMNIPPNWLSYVTVDDVDARAKRVIAAGGKVMKEPFDVMGVGRMAVVQDPTGGTLALWTAKTHIGASVVNEPGSLTWNELYTTDVERARRFYVDVIGWQTEAVDMGPAGIYTLFKRGDGEDKNAGGMMAITKEMGEVPPHWLAYFAVASCDESTEKAKSLGGTVYAPPMDIPNIGRFSVIGDPQGAAFSLFQMAH